ncbi:hypothetical protein [Clostridium sp. BNL1100]|uniref:hypothetical protein n=1 Tax=Clostridium sp. BNL1100 TaxID=755731 RepID=UPI00024A7391|nr:hypothetical protein [Clostridium sp. BNL1100]AEY65513.1 hypothetical protein Clo1100_1265 [Clostridium sp. BNL1100]
MGEIEEELKDLPKEWVELLNFMPSIKAQFIRDKKLNRDEMISPYFFSYFIDDYKRCEPFFLCFESGKEVFDNFYELYGKEEPIITEDKTLNQDELSQLLTKHIYGMNYLLEIGGEETYDIHEMKIKELSEEDFLNQYDSDDIENEDIKGCCSQVMRLNILPDENINPIVEFEEALYELTLDYNLIFYILWPLGKVDDVENPYKPYVELWKKEIKPYIINKNLLVAVR